jgi:hypothetical protein
MGSNNKLRSRIHWDEERIADLFAQVRPRRQLALDSVGVQVKGGVIGAEGRVKRLADPGPSWSEMLNAVVDHLRDNGQLLALRPETVQEYEAGVAEYVFEFTRATKLILPVEESMVKEGGLPPALNIWVSDPPPRLVPPEHSWDFFGAYLFLIEDVNPRPPINARTHLSGISALAWLAKGAQPSRVDADAFQRLGRGDGSHPIQKLEELGARASLERPIETLYQMRYMTDEQGGWSVSDGRVGDLLAYPLAILSSPPAGEDQLPLSANAQ